jgi:hypothetical protein
VLRLPYPHHLYRDGNSQIRRNLNDTFFEKLYIDDCEVVEDELTPLFAELTATKKAILAGNYLEDYNTGEPGVPAKTKTGLPGLAGIFLADGSSKTVLVELIGRNSNLGHLCKKWADLRERINASSPRPPPLYQERSKIRSKRFLTDQDVADIQGRYEGGETTQQIGVSYGVSKTRVARTLREQGVPLRRQGLTNEQASEAADLYAAGKSLACLAARYAVSPMTVSRALRRQGIQLRSRPGW